jgi:hypothetical protein
MATSTSQDGGVATADAHQQSRLTVDGQVDAQDGAQLHALPLFTGAMRRVCLVPLSCDAAESIVVRELCALAERMLKWQQVRLCWTDAAVASLVQASGSRRIASGAQSAALGVEDATRVAQTPEPAVQQASEGGGQDRIFNGHAVLRAMRQLEAECIRQFQESACSVSPVVDSSGSTTTVTCAAPSNSERPYL